MPDTYLDVELIVAMAYASDAMRDREESYRAAGMQAAADLWACQRRVIDGARTGQR